MPSPPTTLACQRTYHLRCYSPAQLRTAYGLDPQGTRGLTGRGTTIAVVDSFGSPTISADLHVFDRIVGLPDPPAISTISPAGRPPTFDPGDADMDGWALETTLDVEYAHVIAPQARILVVATPVSETAGVQGFPEIVRAENYVVDHGLADVISQSFGTPENSFPSRTALLGLRSAFVNAAQHGVTVLAAAGDSGAGDKAEAANWPSTDPLVTSVGGTQLRLDASGHRLTADSVWNDGYGASGGGLSTVFARPPYQDGVRAVVGSRRGTPDVSMSAAVDGGVMVYSSFDATHAGWQIVGGTSEATPLFAGVVAMAAQAAHHRLGLIDAQLYDLAASGRGLVDVRRGDNWRAGVGGYFARPGYDLASGLGTVDAGRFAPSLARAVMLRPST
ncbi:MAG: S53 family peptidase [Pseudonocardia sp.]|nr:S53 family peptidase [Pseudonocardia sp.]